MLNDTPVLGNFATTATYQRVGVKTTVSWMMMATYTVKIVDPLQMINAKSLQLGMTVYHIDIYWGREPMKIVGIREKQVELQGDYSGGTHNVCQSDWESIKGVRLHPTPQTFTTTGRKP